MFLTRDDIKQLTGRSHRARQVASLRRMGIPFYINDAGWPVVAKAVVEGRKGEAPTPRWEPRV